MQEYSSKWKHIPMQDKAQLNMKINVCIYCNYYNSYLQYNLPMVYKSTTKLRWIINHEETKL